MHSLSLQPKALDHRGGIVARGGDEPVHVGRALANQITRLRVERRGKLVQENILAGQRADRGYAQSVLQTAGQSDEHEVGEVNNVWLDPSQSL